MKHLLIAFLLVMPNAAMANATAQVLGLCLDTNETPETRIAHLKAAGWTDRDDALTPLTVALTLPRINAGDPSRWEADRVFSAERAKEAIARDPDTELLEAPDGKAVVFIGRDTLGLQTCLFLSEIVDLAAISAVLEGKSPSRIDTVSRLRGESFKSLVGAHSMTPEGRARFDPPLAYGMSFATQLDRQPGEEMQLPIPRVTR